MCKVRPRPFDFEAKLCKCRPGFFVAERKNRRGAWCERRAVHADSTNEFPDDPQCDKIAL
jgi:hypothetical protein